MRIMTLFIQEAHEIGHDNIVFVHTDSQGAENMITEYINKTERFLRQKKFKIKEELVRHNTQVVKDLGVIESGLDFGLIFTTGCKRTRSCERLLKEYQVPYRITESA